MIEIKISGNFLRVTVNDSNLSNFVLLKLFFDLGLLPNKSSGFGRDKAKSC